MQHLKVTIHIRIRKADGRQPYCSVVWADSKQRKLKPGWAIVNDRPEHHNEGVYHLRYTKAGRRVWENVGKDSVEALKERATVEWVLNNPENVNTLRARTEGADACARASGTRQAQTVRSPEAVRGVQAHHSQEGRGPDSYRCPRCSNSPTPAKGPALQNAPTLPSSQRSGKHHIRSRRVT